MGSPDDPGRGEGWDSVQQLRSLQARAHGREGSVKFLHYEVDTSDGDEVVVALSGNAANVRLMDTLNFSSFRRGRRHSYLGGHFTRSPAVLRPPHGGHWHVVVDLGGYRGSVHATVRVMRSGSSLHDLD
ncbi:DUF1883 domain-containing protein [Myxococcus sp. AM011]|uniref:DUF1883 domain-containing protein n=1 Tax=Myxococcus sp. AM011 TaxID=2745200 RepID=UPI0034CF0180